MTKRATFLLILLTAVSCEKDYYNYSGTFSSDRTETSTVRLFTSSGEVMNQALISTFLARYQAENYFNDGGTAYEVKGKLKIDFISESRAEFIWDGDSETRNIIRRDGILYFEAETTTNYFDNSSYPISSEIKTYFPLESKKVPLPSGTGISMMNVYKHCYYAMGDRYEVSLPMLSYLFTRNIPGYLQGVSGEFNINNRFNEGSLTLLTENDTLVVQESILVFRK